MAIKTETLGFNSLSDLDDGRIDALLALHLKRIAQDCIDRPADSTKRKVTLEFLCEPVTSQDGNCDHARIEIDCASKLPVYRSRPYEMRVTKAGFLFNVDDPTALDQHHLFREATE